MLKKNFFYNTIILFGHKNAGKTFLSKKLASYLDFSFLDTDLLIEERYFKENKSLSKKLSAKKIFIKEKEEYFRNIEEEEFFKLFYNFPNVKNKHFGFKVISLGGGTLLNKKIFSFIKNYPPTSLLKIYLEISLNTFLKRNLKEKDLPYKKPLKEIFFERNAIFEKIQAIKINMDKPLKEKELKKQCQIVLEKSLK